MNVTLLLVWLAGVTTPAPDSAAGAPVAFQSAIQTESVLHPPAASTVPAPGGSTSSSPGRVPGPSSPASTVVEDEPLFASPTRLDRIGRIVAPVYINGQGPFRLVVDTGATHSSLSPQLAQTLGLDTESGIRVRLHGVTGVAEVPAVQLNIVRAGDLVIRDVRAPVVWSSIMAGADGILGVAGLQRERIIVDFRNDRIYISRSRSARELWGHMTIPGRLVSGGLLAIDAHVGRVPVRAIIDTGAERTLGNLALRDALRRRMKSNLSTVTTVYGTTTDVSHGELERVPPISLGPATVTDVSVVYGEFHIFKVWDLEDRPALLLGMDVLGTVNSLIIDYRHRELHFKSR